MDEYAHNVAIALLGMAIFIVTFKVTTDSASTAHKQLCEIITNQQAYINQIKEGVNK